MPRIHFSHLQGANPGRGLPLLSREEAAMMASGAAELARLRRLGTKHIKHAPSARSVALPLEQLNSGCMKTVTFSRRRVDDHGIEYSSTRSFYLVIRCGLAGRWVKRQRRVGGGSEGLGSPPATQEQGKTFLILQQSGA